MNDLLMKETVKGVTQVEKLSIEELIEDLEMEQLQAGVEKWNIVECFNGKINTYRVEGFSAESEEGIVYCGDNENVLINSSSVLMGFCETSIAHIIKETSEHGSTYVICFKEDDSEEGYVLIKPLAAN